MPRIDEVIAAFAVQAERFEINWQLPWYGGTGAEKLWNHPLLQVALNLEATDLDRLIDEMIASPSFALRGIACHLVLARRRTNALPAVRALVASDESVPVRALAVSAIGGMALDDAGRQALHGVHDGEHLEVKKALIKVFDTTRDQAATAKIAAWATSPSDDESTRIQAAETLGRLGGDAAIAALVQILDDESNADGPRAAAARALGVIGGDLAKETLARHADTARPWVRAAVLTGLGLVDASGFEAKLIAATDGKEPWMIRTAATEALGRSAGVATRDRLAALTSDSLAAVRGEAVAALGRSEDESLLPTLKSALDDADLGVQIQAVAAIAKITGRDFGLTDQAGRPMLDLQAVKRAVEAARAS